MNILLNNKNSKGIASLLVLGGLLLVGVLALFLFRNPKDLIQSFAWDCSKYTFNVEQDGTVTVINASSRDERDQRVTVGIVIGNNAPVVYTFNVPALPAYGTTPTQIGKVEVPSDGVFKWGAQGSRDCLNQGEYTAPPAPNCTNTFSFSVQN